MSKARDTKKDSKKKPAQTLKEKRKTKHDKDKTRSRDSYVTIPAE